MPKPWFVRDIEKLGEADGTHVQLLAKQYHTSLEATANRYVDLTDDTCAIIFSKDNVVRYLRRTSNFPFLSLKTNDPLPSGCASLHTALHPLRVASEWLEIDGSVWLETKWGKAAPKLLEQSVRQSDGYQTTEIFSGALTLGALDDIIKDLLNDMIDQLLFKLSSERK